MIAVNPWRRLFPVAALVVIGLLVAVPAAAQAEPVVHAVLFWDKACPNCEFVLNETLPPIEARYGAQLEVVRAEVSSVLGTDTFILALDQYQVPAELKGVPLLVIGDRALAGRDEIAQDLESEIERGLAAGGLAVPPTLGLTAEEVAALDAYSQTVWDSGHATDRTANAAALIVLGLMGLSLVYTGATVRRAPSRTIAHVLAEAPRKQSGWIPILTIVGLVVSGYLSYIELTGSAVVCPIGRCEAVQHSPYSELLGVPVAVLGFLAYAAILLMWLWGESGAGRWARLAPVGIFGAGLVGTIFSAYLTYLEPFVIKAVCFWCLASAVVISAILVVSLQQVTPRGSAEA